MGEKLIEQEIQCFDIKDGGMMGVGGRGKGRRCFDIKDGGMGEIDGWNGGN